MNTKIAEFIGGEWREFLIKEKFAQEGDSAKDDNHDCHLIPNYGEGHCDHPSHKQ